MKLSCDPGLTVTAFQTWLAGRPMDRFSIRPKGDTPLAKLLNLCEQLQQQLKSFDVFELEAIAIEDNGPKARADRREGVVRLQQCIATLQCFFWCHAGLECKFVSTGSQCANTAGLLANSMGLKRLNHHEEAALLVGYLAGFDRSENE